MVAGQATRTRYPNAKKFTRRRKYVEKHIQCSPYAFMCDDCQQEIGRFCLDLRPISASVWRTVPHESRGRR